MKQKETIILTQFFVKFTSVVWLEFRKDKQNMKNKNKLLIFNSGFLKIDRLLYLKEKTNQKNRLLFLRNF